MRTATTNPHISGFFYVIKNVATSNYQNYLIQEFFEGPKNIKLQGSNDTFIIRWKHSVYELVQLLILYSQI